MSDDPTLAPEEGPAFDVLARNAHYLVARDDDGYAVWTSRLDADHPIARFPDTDEGAELSFERFAALTRLARTPALLRVLFVISMVSGVLWTVGSAYATWDYLGFTGADTQDRRTVRLVIGVTSDVAYPLFLVAFGTFVSVWMWRRMATSEA